MWGLLRRRGESAAVQSTEPLEDSLAGLAGIALTKEFLNGQITFYDREAKKHSLAYHGTKAATIIVAAVIPFLAGQPGMAVATGLLGVVIVILQGLQQLFNVHENWIRYRSTCEALRSEGFLFGAQAGPYAGGGPEAERRLAEQVGAIVRQEYSRWATVQQQPATGTEKPANSLPTTATPSGRPVGVSG
jgi:hypothetical protein